MNISLRQNDFLKRSVILTLIATLVLSIFANPITATAQSEELSESEINAIASGAYYNQKTGLYVYDEDIAIENGAKVEHANAMGAFLESLSKEDVEKLNQEINFDPKAGYDGDGVSIQAIPLVLIPIAKFLGGAAGAAIIAEVTLYGIAKACENLEGKYGFFDDFCETRGHI